MENEKKIIILKEAIIELTETIEKMNKFINFIFVLTIINLILALVH